MRLDKYISQATDLTRKEVKRLIKDGYIHINDTAATNGSQQVPDSSIVTLDGEPINKPGPRYFMLYKPEGYVSVTKDSEHPSVLELLDEPNKDKLQIAGRLDLDTTGLLLITDDGQWNHAVTSPKRDCQKVYHVTLAQDISENTEEKFRAGILLDGEIKPTLPASMETVYSNEVKLTIQEGKYHQVKRMFAAVGNRVIELHRESVGQIQLDSDLAPGEYRPLTTKEVQSVMAAG